MSGKIYVKTEDSDIEFGGAKHVVDEEIAHIKTWRGQAPRAGIALSGGGIRSASFGLGVLQSLAYSRWLPEFDYLSTVSGGGYIGSSLSYLLHCSQSAQGQGIHPVKPVLDVSREHFPYLSYPMVGARLPEQDEYAAHKGALLRRLRQNAKYLTPGNGITLLSLIGVVLRNSLASVFVHVGLLVLALLLLIGLGFLDSDAFPLPVAWKDNGMLLASAAFFGTYALISVLYVLLSGFFDSMIGRFGVNAAYVTRRSYEWLTHWSLLLGISVLIVAVLPWIHHVLGEHVLGEALAKVLGDTVPASSKYPVFVGTGTSVSGILASVWAYLQSSSTKKPRIPTGLLVTLASALLLFGVLLLAFDFARGLHLETGGWWMQVIVLVVALFFLGWIPNVNYLSVHRYYRDRLMETFMPDVKQARENPDQRSGPTWTGNGTMMGDLCGVGANFEAPDKRRGPYHLVNTNIVLVSSDNPRYRGRGGDNFIFSPLFTGSHATGWKRTDPRPKSGITLATAMAISGAAVNPNTGCGGEGITRQPVLSVLMGLLNIRLGYWLNNPRRAAARATSVPDKTASPAQAAKDADIRQQRQSLWSSLLSLSVKPNLISPGIFESFGRYNLREDKRYVLLSDGGHFENLGLYELVRRRLKLIVVCDGAADAEYGFADLANAIEKVRADFGAVIDINSDDLDVLVPHRRDSYPKDDAIMPVATRGYLIASIKYAPLNPGASPEGAAARAPQEECGLLVYLTTTFFKELSSDLHGYRQSHPEFPDEPTSDQFFDEKQFEAYRELGYQTAWRMMLETSDTASGDDVNLNGVRLPKAKAGAPC